MMYILEGFFRLTINAFLMCAGKLYPMSKYRPSLQGTKFFELLRDTDREELKMRKKSYFYFKMSSLQWFYCNDSHFSSSHMFTNKVSIFLDDRLYRKNVMKEPTCLKILFILKVFSFLVPVKPQNNIHCSNNASCEAEPLINKIMSLISKFLLAKTLL